MILCSNMCYPCCDFCIYAKHTIWKNKKGQFTGPPDGCNFYEDKEHQLIAIDDGYCKDFQCISAKKPHKWIEINNDLYEQRKNKKWKLIDIFKNN